MPFLRRNELGWNERYRRCLYFFLRDELDAVLINESLIESYKEFKAANKEYPFVEMRELKPRSKIHAPEYPEQRHFIVIFMEDALPAESKIHIRFFDSNKVTKENLSYLSSFDLRDTFHQRMRYFEDPDFTKLICRLMGYDFALLIQRDVSVKARYRYALTHFHVKIDWPIAQAAENMGRFLRYISKDLFEKGDRYAELLQQKVYEYYGFHHTVGGRRTAAFTAMGFMTHFDFIGTVYVASSEARVLYRASEQGIAKYTLLRVTEQDIRELCILTKMKEKDFISSYLIDMTPTHGVGIFLVTYKHNEHSRPPQDGKLRELLADYQWLNVDLQLLVPPPSSGDARPIPLSRIYA
jgi:hypothetical protein